MHRASTLAIIARLSGRPATDIEPEMHLVADLGFDSMKALELVVDLEEALALTLSDDDVQSIRTVRDVLSAVDGAQPSG